MLQNSSAFFKFHDINKSLSVFLVELTNKIHFFTCFTKVYKKVGLSAKKRGAHRDK